MSITGAANEKPVIFLNSYQSTSKYWFYTEDTGFAINTASYRQNNYNIWGISKNFQGKEIALITSEKFDSADILIETTKGNLNVHTENAVSFETNTLFYMQRKMNVKSGQPVVLKGKFYGTDEEHLQKDKIFLQLVDNKKITTELQCIDIRLTGPDCTIFFAPPHLAKGKYIGKICIRTSIKNISSLNSNIISITSEDE